MTLIWFSINLLFGDLHINSRLDTKKYSTITLLVFSSYDVMIISNRLFLRKFRDYYFYHETDEIVMFLSLHCTYVCPTYNYSGSFTAIRHLKLIFDFLKLCCCFPREFRDHHRSSGSREEEESPQRRFGAGRAVLSLHGQILT